MTGYQGPIKAQHALGRMTAGLGIAAWDIGWSHAWYTEGVRSQGGWVILSATDGQPVSTWVNDMVAADNLAQATEAQQPLFRRNGGIAGKVAIEGRKVANGILSVDFTADIPQPYSVVHIGRFPADPVTDANISDNYTGGSNVRIYYEADDDTIRLHCGTILTGPAITSSLTSGHLIVCHGHGDGSFVELDNATRVTGAAGTATMTGLTMFGTRTAAALTDWRAEFVGIYPGDVTTDDRWRTFLQWVEEEWLLDMSL